jgi:hypothetical protein
VAGSAKRMSTDDDLPDPDPIDEEMADIDARDPDVVEEIEDVKEDAEALGRDVEDPPV